MKRLPFLTLALLLATTGAALATTSFDEVLKASPDGVVEIRLISGSLAIEGTDGSEVSVTGSVGADVDRIDFTSTGGRTSLKVVPRKNLGSAWPMV